MSCEETLRELSLTSLAERKLKGNLAAFSTRREVRKMMEPKNPTEMVADDNRKGKWPPPTGKFRLDVRKTFFTWRAVQQWKKLPKDDSKFCFCRCI